MLFNLRGCSLFIAVRKGCTSAFIKVFSDAQRRRPERRGGGGGKKILKFHSKLLLVPSKLAGRPFRGKVLANVKAAEQSLVYISSPEEHM